MRKFSRDYIRFLAAHWGYRIRREIEAFVGGIRAEIYEIEQKIKHTEAKISIKRDQLRSKIVKDEFDRSLDMNVVAMFHLNKAERDEYISDLIRRRNLAHRRDLESC